MLKCTRCGEEFDLTKAKRSIGQIFGKGSYNKYCTDGVLCKECAKAEISMFYCLRAELNVLMNMDFPKD